MDDRESHVETDDAMAAALARLQDGDRQGRKDWERGIQKEAEAARRECWRWASTRRGQAARQENP
jgi:hypothetical protein